MWDVTETTEKHLKYFAIKAKNGQDRLKILAPRRGQNLN